MKIHGFGSTRMVFFGIGIALQLATTARGSTSGGECQASALERFRIYGAGWFESNSENGTAGPFEASLSSIENNASRLEGAGDVVEALLELLVELKAALERGIETPIGTLATADLETELRLLPLEELQVLQASGPQ
jgi:hypothetical protein